jgi:hypothetical protein
MSDGTVTETRFEVVRDDLTRTRTVQRDLPALAEGQVLAAVDSFGFTANNISYAVFGDVLGYWGFFPSEGEWGQIPTWGFADVVASAHDDVAVGTRLFGYFPMASHLVLSPGAVDATSLFDAAEHRSALPPAYNSYRLVGGDPLYDPDREDEQMLLWPLFFTAFVLDRFLGANDVFGATTVVLSSASSKTALATAHCLAERGGLTVVGLTSPANVEVVDAVGRFDRVLAYDRIDTLVPEAAVYVDFAGDTAVRAAVHTRYGDHLAHSAMVGGTHWDQTAPAEVPGPAPVFFFAPGHWDAAAEAELPDAWRGFVSGLDDWLRIEHRSGVDAVEAAYLDTLAGRIDPAVGLVLSF